MGNGINPLLIQVMTGEALAEGERPRVSDLPGRAAKRIYQHRSKIELLSPVNIHSLRCTECGHDAEYDLGQVFCERSSYMAAPDTEEKRNNPNYILDYIQSTGYFRCDNCNRAGKWELVNNSLMASLIVEMLGKLDDPGSLFEGAAMFDGFRPRWGSDGEEHYLKLLQENPADSLIWNKLGNIYNRGNRPELAAAVFERSLELDQGQVESHYTLARMWQDAHFYDEAAYHYHQALLHAAGYTHLPDDVLKNMLAICLLMLSKIVEITRHRIPFLPTAEDHQSAKKITPRVSNTPPQGSNAPLAITDDDWAAYYPLAEWYMNPEDGKLPVNSGAYGPIGSEGNPIKVQVSSDAQAEHVQQICSHFGWHYEMLRTDIPSFKQLLQAVLDVYEHTEPYDPCPCRSSAKFKFCCAKAFKSGMEIKQFVVWFAERKAAVQ